jgi:hypothetical protein
MRESIKIAIGVFLGLSATCLCAIIIILIISGTGIAFLNSIINDLMATETAIYNQPTTNYEGFQSNTTLSPSKTKNKDDGNLERMTLTHDNLILLYDPIIWTISTDQYGITTITNKQIIECQLSDGGIGEVFGKFKEAIVLGEYSFDIYERINKDGRIIREYLGILGPGISTMTGRPYLILMVPPFNSQICIENAHSVIETLRQE